MRHISSGLERNNGREKAARPAQAGVEKGPRPALRELRGNAGRGKRRYEMLELGLPYKHGQQGRAGVRNDGD